ncbi:MAG: hypothetical protein A2437_00755 [Bacteroidetes bacterium RIFOXYC2_FULL_40_12]|nr:MAG: hypothetical protein A2437_00755 [Bacteroidetes bacterium RIFOXYC2_FULL_40_12]
MKLMRVNTIYKTIWQMLLIFLCLSVNKAFPQSDTTNIYDLDLTQLAKLKIVTASKVSQNIKEVPSTIYVITAEQIKENGYFTLEEALSVLPGFQFRNIMGFNSYVFQRGVPNQNNYILVLIDGIQVNELNSGGFYAGGQYNLSNVERVEVIYGPSSVAYGTNAITGIINIITKNPTENKAEANVLAGNFNTFLGNFTSTYLNKSNTFGISVSGMAKKTDKADLRGKAGDFNWTDRMENFENDYSFDLKIKAKDFVFGTNFLQKQSSTSTNIKSVGTIYRDYGTLWNIRFINNYLKYKKNLTNKTEYSLTLYNRNATVLNNSIQYVTDTAQIGYYRPNNLTGIDNLIEYQVTSDFSVVSGVTLEYERLAERFSVSYSGSQDQKPAKPRKPNMLNNYLVSVFAEPHITLMKNLFLSGGIRFDHSSVYDQVLTPRLGLSYSPGIYLFRVSAADAFRAPKPWDYTDGLGNSGLLPEKMRSFEEAIQVSPTTNFDIAFIGYKNILNEAIKKEFLDESYRWVNRGKIETNGFELNVKYIAGKFKSQWNYTFNQSRDELEHPIPEISKHTANASITYSINQYVKLNLRANYIGERENYKVIATTNSIYIDPCLVFHGTFSLLDYKNFSAQLLVKNIFDKEYYHPSNREPDRYRQPQRTVLLTIGYTFK